jgi:hypothetical protein
MPSAANLAILLANNFSALFLLRLKLTPLALGTSSASSFHCGLNYFAAMMAQ